MSTKVNSASSEVILVNSKVNSVSSEVNSGKDVVPALSWVSWTCTKELGRAVVNFYPCELVLLFIRGSLYE